MNSMPNLFEMLGLRGARKRRLRCARALWGTGRRHLRRTRKFLSYYGHMHYHALPCTTMHCVVNSPPLVPNGVI